MFITYPHHSVVSHTLMALALLSLAACSSSNANPDPGTNSAASPVTNPATNPGGSTDATNANNTGATTDPATPDNTNQENNNPVQPSSGQYDLASYVFHKDVLVDGGAISFTEKFYTKESEGEPTLGVSVIELARGFNNSGGAINELSDGATIKTFRITATEIQEALLENDDSRVSKRFASVGEEYLNANSKPTDFGGTTIQQNARCVLLEHMDSFDLTSATGTLNLTSGSYNDVLKVECKTGFAAGANSQPHTTLRSYFAKGVGVIFSEGEVLLFGDVYVVEEY